MTKHERQRLGAILALLETGEAKNIFRARDCLRDVLGIEKPAPKAKVEPVILPEPPPSVEKARVHIRWMIRRDMPEVLANDEASYGAVASWDEQTFLRTLRDRNCIGMVAEHGEKVVGHMVYLLHKHCLEVIRFAVAPKWQRLGIGFAMIEKLKSKLSGHRRTRLTFTINEANQEALHFLKARGFRCTGLLREHFGERDGYRMTFRLDDEPSDFNDTFEREFVEDD